MSNKQLLNTVFISLFAYAQAADSSFYNQVASVKKDLYKLSSAELCDLLGSSCTLIPTIPADQLKQIMSTESPLLVVNVLPEKYYNDCHIKGSINAPLPDLVEKAESWDRSQKIVVYCALDECDAGEKGGILLSNMGFENVIDYKGGIKEWYQLGYPTVGPAVSEYLHTKGVPTQDEFKLYPEIIVCSRQTRWIHKYQK